MARPRVEPAHAYEIEPVAMSAFARGWPARTTLRPLSRDPGTNAITGVVHLPAGTRRPAGALAAECDTYVMSGTLEVGGEPRGRGHYEYAPAGSRHEAWVVREDCELFLMARDGAPDLVDAATADPRALAIDSAAMEWAITPIPGLPGGVFLKLLRADPETGESVFLMSVVAGWQLDGLEYHDMDEECITLAGDVWVGNAGSYGPGSYFARPSYTTHGPFHTRGGFVALQWCSTHVVNHFTEDPLSSRARNRAAAALQPPPQDHLTGLRTP